MSNGESPRQPQLDDFLRSGQRRALAKPPRSLASRLLFTFLGHRTSVDVAAVATSSSETLSYFYFVFIFMVECLEINIFKSVIEFSNTICTLFKGKTHFNQSICAVDRAADHNTEAVLMLTKASAP